MERLGGINAQARASIAAMPGMVDLHPEFARVLLANVPGGLAFLDRQDRVQWVNTTFAVLLGTDQRRLLGRPAATLPFPLHPIVGAAEYVRAVGDLILTEKVLTDEPWVGRMLHLVPRRAFAPLFVGEPTAERELPVNMGILSRELGLQRLVSEISRSRRYDNPLSCCIGRVRGVTPALLNHGLEVLGQLMKEQLRWVDVVVQWSADRVLIILPETGAEAAQRLHRKMLETVTANWQVEGASVYFGLATWRRGDDALRLVRRAEAASEIGREAGSLRSPR
jgi:GGDEF domain-containing protein